jgi:hypothetical protein
MIKDYLLAEPAPTLASSCSPEHASWLSAATLHRIFRAASTEVPRTRSTLLSSFERSALRALFEFASRPAFQ